MWNEYRIENLWFAVKLKIIPTPLLNLIFCLIFFSILLPAEQYIHFEWVSFWKFHFSWNINYLQQRWINKFFEYIAMRLFFNIFYCLYYRKKSNLCAKMPYVCLTFIHFKVWNSQWWENYSFPWERKMCDE